MLLLINACFAKYMCKPSFVTIKGHKSRKLCFFASIGAEELHACREAYDIGSEVFEIRSCPCGQVIHVRSAVIGLSPQWDPNADPPICPMNGSNCTTETSHSDIMSCNKATSCRISQKVLEYALPAELCDGQEHGNFIRIVYDCVNPGKTSQSGSCNSHFF